MTIVKHIYGLLILFLSPLMGFAFLFSQRGRSRLRERFGLGERLSGGVYLWIHGASLGEIRGVLPLVHRIQSQTPNLAILISATSPTAQEALEGTSVEFRLLPFDHPLFLRIAMRGAQIRALVICETEIWPGLIAFAEQKRVPVALVNARISDYTIKRYRKMVRIFPDLFKRFKIILAADRASQARFQGLGASEVLLTGNMKYDRAPSIAVPDAQLRWRRQLPFADAPLLVLGSLRPGEEPQWFRAIGEHREAKRDFGCILAPRHMEKVGYFVEELRKAGLTYCRMSERNQWLPENRPDVLLLDTFGDLEACYSIAQLVFIGATLVDIGGHNPLEAAAYGVPIVVGPYDATVREITEQLTLRDGLIRISPEQDLVPLLLRMITGDSELCSLGLRGHEVWRENQGATEAVCSHLGAIGILPVIAGQGESAP